MFEFVFFLLSTIISLCNAATCSSETAAGCRSAGGYCMNTAYCPSSNYISNLCPGPANIKCCRSAPFQESACQTKGGNCKDSCDCTGGTALTGYCPTQPAGIKCCVPSTTPAPTTATGCSGVTIVTRAQWGATAPKQTVSIPNGLSKLFVHHTVGVECKDLTSCKTEVKSIQNYHMKTNGWWDIAYSFLIGGDGRVYEGRGWNVQGSHTEGYNSVSYAFSFMGDFTSKNPTAAAIQAYNNLALCAVQKAKLTSTYNMFGHRQVKATACPGNTLYTTIQAWPRWTSSVTGK